jgi:hypothetical protein
MWICCQSKEIFHMQLERMKQYYSMHGDTCILVRCHLDVQHYYLTCGVLETNVRCRHAVEYITVINLSGQP